MKMSQGVLKGIIAVTVFGGMFATGAGRGLQTSRVTQAGTPTQTTPSSSFPGFPDTKKAVDQDPTRARMEESAAKSRNSDRFRRIQTETEKLLRLSTELKADVDKSTKNELSLDVIRKAEEIEKLAHDVKERMKG